MAYYHTETNNSSTNYSTQSAQIDLEEFIDGLDDKQKRRDRRRNTSEKRKNRSN